MKEFQEIEALEVSKVEKSEMYNEGSVSMSTENTRSVCHVDGTTDGDN